MKTRYLLYVALIVSVFIAGGLCSDWLRAPVLAQDEVVATGTQPIAIKPVTVVTAVPYEVETRYEMDPFETDHIRSTTSQLKTVLVVRSDGSTEIVKAK